MIRVYCKSCRWINRINDENTNSEFICEKCHKINIRPKFEKKYKKLNNDRKLKKYYNDQLAIIWMFLFITSFVICPGIVDNVIRITLLIFLLIYVIARK